MCIRTIPHVLQFIPARGRKPFTVAVNRRGRGCNLSPRGDGNFRDVAPVYHLISVAIYPREGTETFIQKAFFRQLQVAIYPREGTETSLSCGSSVSRPKVAIYPREGTETVYDAVGEQPPNRLQFIPARGRKPVRKACVQVAGKLQFIPARGRKLNPFPEATPPACCNLSPRGDGNLMARPSPA